MKNTKQKHTETEANEKMRKMLVLGKKQIMYKKEDRSMTQFLVINIFSQLQCQS